MEAFLKIAQKLKIISKPRGAFNLPLYLNLGKAFAKNLSAQFGPEYVVSGPDSGVLTFMCHINAVFPSTKNK